VSRAECITQLAAAARAWTTGPLPLLCFAELPDTTNPYGRVYRLSRRRRVLTVEHASRLAAVSCVLRLWVTAATSTGASALLPPLACCLTSRAVCCLGASELALQRVVVAGSVACMCVCVKQKGGWIGERRRERSSREGGRDGRTDGRREGGVYRRVRGVRE
jgi:hypothetical protein